MPAVSFATFQAELIALYSPPLRAAATQAKVRQVLDELDRLGAVRTTHDLSPATIAAWIARPPRHRRPETWRSKLRTLRAICRYAVFRGYLDTDPFAWRPPSAWIPGSTEEAEAEPFDRHKSNDELRRTLDQADHEARHGGWSHRRLQALIYIYAFTGMRRNEALGLMVADCNLHDRVITIRGNPRRKLKTRRSAQPLAMAPPLADVLTRWLPETGSVWAIPGSSRGGPWLSGGPGVRAADQLRDLGRRAGVEGLTPLAFRHSFATLAESWGLGELELQRWLRHTNCQTQKSYRKADLDNLRHTANKIQFSTTKDTRHAG